MEEPLPRSQSPTDELIASRVIAIIRTDDAARILPLARAIIDGGIRAIEISLTSPGALDAIARLSTEVPAGTMVGAGTVLSAAQAEAAIRAGSRFLFSPSFNAEVLGIAQVHRIPFIPAALTPNRSSIALPPGTASDQALSGGISGGRLPSRSAGASARASARSQQEA
jgi:2-dehydro-3-deoxyphosphogluconate aldolase/(4S)-4-hydroxy-2-oxoglutarate aldolase